MTVKDLFNKKYAFNIAVIILSFIIASKIYKHQETEINLLQQKKGEAEKRNQLLGNISQFEKRTLAYRALFAKTDTGMTIDTFSKIAKDTGVKIMGVRPMPEQKLAGYAKTPFDLVLSAPSFHALGKFISKIESYKEVYMVDILDIRSYPQIKDLSVNATICHFAATN